MSGCFGNSAIDRHMESQLDAHLSAGEADEEAIGKAEESYGAHLGATSDGVQIFKEGIGVPHFEEDWDEDGKSSPLVGMKSARCYQFHGTNRVLVEEVRFVKGKRKSRVIEVTSTYSVELES